MKRSFRSVVAGLLMLVPGVLRAQIAVITASPTSFSGLIPQASYTINFTVKNTDDTGEFTIDNARGASGCSFSVTDTVIPMNVTINVFATCTAGAANSSGNFGISVHSTAFGTDDKKLVPWTTGADRIQLTGPTGVGAGTAIVHTPRPVIRAVFTPLAGDNFDTTTTQVLVGGADLTSIARFNRGQLEVEVDSAHQLSPGWSTDVEVHQCTTTGHCTYVSGAVTLANDSTPLVDLTAMPLERSGAGQGGSFGPGLSLDGVDVKAGFSIPAYISVGASRSAGLVYSTRTSYPRALVAANITLPWTADTVKSVLIEGGVRKDSISLPSSACVTAGTATCRVVLQADYASASPMGVSKRWFLMEVSVRSGGVLKAATDSVEGVLVDRRDSPYGSGWWPTSALSLVTAGTDKILVNPDGNSALFRGSGDTLYLSPPGSTTGLLKVGTGWELHPRGSHAKVVFDASGRFLKAVDASANRDSLSYDGSGRPVTLFDPLGKKITFYYNATTGKLDSLVSLVGLAGHRTTRVTIDTATNQLRYDSLSSPAAHPVMARYGYQTFGSVKGTNLIRARAGRYGSDSVMVLYDSTAGGSSRPIQANLLAPFSGGSPPIIAYKAAELQGWKSYRSRDSIYAQVTDPLGHWTRSRVDRWGGSTLTWDQIGTMARASFDPIGRVLWSEGKVADSSRVYTTYDSRGRVVRTYMLRSGMAMLRLDSLTYDSFERISQRIDWRGGVTTFAHDSADRVYSEGSPAGSTTRAFRSDGQLQKILLPTKTTWDSVQYDAAFHNPVAWYADSGQLVRSSVLDSMGRAIQSDSRIRVADSGTLKWQVRRVDSYLDLLGRADSTTVSQSSQCNDPCTSPSGFTVLRTTKPTLDSIGQAVQVQVVGNNASTETFNFDRLGRVIGHGAMGGARDSMVYDLAGNVTKSITRRGDTLTTSYDSRNRSDSAYVPGYGTVHSTYGGPGDQLTRLHVTGYVDSLGAVNPDRVFVYDQRGRLVSDTLWTGSRARGRSHAYDTLDRPSTLTDTLGTQTVQYMTTIGLVSKVIESTGDTLAFTYDSVGRPSVFTILRGASNHLPIDSIKYSSAGELLGMVQRDSTSASSWYGGSYVVNSWTQTGPYAGKNQGVILRNSLKREIISLGVAQPETSEDSMSYDAFRRLKSWREGAQFGWAGAVSETYAYDNNGNLTIGSDSTAFASGSNRLTLIKRAGGKKSVYTYDAAGNLTQRDDSASGVLTCSWQYGYNALGQMVSVRAKAAGGSFQVVARYAYDVGGSRIARRVYTNTANCTSTVAGYTRYAVHGAQVAYETDSVGSSILRRYIWGPGSDNLVAVQVGASIDSIFYASTDKLGSVKAWMKKDGSLRWWGRYRPYGAAIDSGGTTVVEPYHWVGREYDPETGFYFMRARYYDPSIGRFTQEDPLGDAGGRNPYAYVDGRPLEMRDPSGMTADPSTYADPCPCYMHASNQYVDEAGYFIFPYDQFAGTPFSYAARAAWERAEDLQMRAMLEQLDHGLAVPLLPEVLVGEEDPGCMSGCNASYGGDDGSGDGPPALESAFVRSDGYLTTEVYKYAPLTQGNVDWVAEARYNGKVVEGIIAGVEVWAAGPFLGIGSFGGMVAGVGVGVSGLGMDYNPHVGDRATMTTTYNVGRDFILYHTDVYAPGLVYRGGYNSLLW